MLYSRVLKCLCSIQLISQEHTISKVALVWCHPSIHKRTLSFFLGMHILFFTLPIFFVTPFMIIYYLSLYLFISHFSSLFSTILFFFTLQICSFVSLCTLFPLFFILPRCVFMSLLCEYTSKYILCNFLFFYLFSFILFELLLNFFSRGSEREKIVLSRPRALTKVKVKVKSQRMVGRLKRVTKAGHR